MKLNISDWRETSSFVRITTKNPAALKSSRRCAEMLFIGAPTESPSTKVKTMKIKSFVYVAGLATLCATNTFATPLLNHI